MRLWRDGHQPTALVKIIDTRHSAATAGAFVRWQGVISEIAPSETNKKGSCKAGPHLLALQENCSEDTPATRGEGGNKHYYAPARLSVLQSSTSARGGVEKTIPRSRNELARS
jgi:hypothetical protein